MKTFSCGRCIYFFNLGGSLPQNCLYVSWCKRFLFNDWKVGFESSVYKSSTQGRANFFHTLKFSWSLRVHDCYAGNSWDGYEIYGSL